MRGCSDVRMGGVGRCTVSRVHEREKEHMWTKDSECVGAEVKMGGVGRCTVSRASTGDQRIVRTLWGSGVSKS